MTQTSYLTYPPRFPYDVSSLKHWLKCHAIEEVEIVTPDFAGFARGKVMPTQKFHDLKPTYLPISIFFQTITGNYIEQEEEQFWTERDMQLIPDLATLRRVPWATDRSVQVIHDLHHLDGNPVNCAPRNVLKRILQFYDLLNLSPIVAPELEFYLTSKNTDPDYPLEPPVGRSGRQSIGRQAYSISAVDEYEDIINDIYDFAEAQGLEIDTIIQEEGAAQIEINFMHGNPLDLADQIFVFKRLIREAAFRHDCYATFMAKPMENEPGSAMHIHQSILNKHTGQNIFSQENGEASPEFYHFIAGQQKFLPAATSLMAPYVNSYRRMVAFESAAVNLEWGYDNRSVGLRIPHSPPQARRVENRVVGADTNPYLAIAASLACGYLGLRQKLSPRDAFQGNAYKAPNDIPRSLAESLREFDKCPDLKALLTDDFSDLYITIKAQEYDEFMQVISPWEREHLLLTV